MKIHTWFLPTKKNQFHPHALRPLGLLVFLFVFAIIPPLYNVTATGQFQILGYATNVNITDLYALSNQERVNVGLSNLTLDSQLSSAALAKANDMFAKDYWAHVAPDGTTPWSFIYAAGYDYQTAGENLAKGFDTSAGVIAGWMGSPTHKENVLNTSYTDVGYATVNGVLLGSETTLVVAMYGSRMAIAPTPQTSTSSTPTAIVKAEPQTTPVPTETTVVEAPIPDQQPVVETTVPTTNDSSAEPLQQQVSMDASGVVEGIESILPIKAYNSLNWGQKASIALVCTMILLFIMKHTLIWRERKYGIKHIWLRSHPIGQASLLIVVLIITMLSSAGTVL